MTGLLEIASAELAEMPIAAEPPAVIELRSVLLALGDDTFDPDSVYATGLITATEKMERMLDDVWMWINRARRGLSPDIPVE